MIKIKINSLKLPFIIFVMTFLQACGSSDSSNTSTNVTEQEIALEKIAAYADVGSNPKPTLQDYLDAGVSGVNSENLAELNAVVDGLVAEYVDSTAELDELASKLTTNVLPTANAGNDNSCKNDKNDKESSIC